MRLSLASLVAGLTAFTLVASPIAAMPEAHAQERYEDMSTLSRVLHIGGGAGLIAGGLAPTVVMGYAGSSLFMGALVAVVGATAAPAVGAVLIVGALGAGTYFLAKGIIGKKRADGTAGGLNSGRNDRTSSPDGRPPAGSPGRIGGRDGAGTPR